jgi:hypothetical protein
MCIPYAYIYITTGLPVAVWQVILLEKLTLWVQPIGTFTHNRSVLAAARDIAAASTACTDMHAAAGDWTALGESLKPLPAVGIDWDLLLREPLRCTAAQLKAAARACYCTVGGVSASAVIVHVHIVCWWCCTS